MKCVDTDKINVQVKDLSLQQGQGRNLSLFYIVG